MKISKNLKDLPLIKVSEIQNLQGNLKDLDQTNFDKLKLRIENHGFKYPMYLWKSKDQFYNLDGNQRQRVIQKAWGDIEVPYIEIEAKNEKEAKKEILAISSQYGKVTKEGFDEFAFDFELEDWAEVEMETTFDGLMDEEIPEAEEDGYEEPDNMQVDVVLGDLVTFEKDSKELHRLLCGDSTDSDQVAKLMNGEKADMVFTSPPYNANMNMISYEDGKVVSTPFYDNNETDNKSPEEFIQFLGDALNNCIINTDGFIFWNIGYNAKSRYEWLVNTYNFKDYLREVIIWKKSSAMPVKHGFTRIFEFIFMYSTKKIGVHFNGTSEIISNYWEIGNNNSSIDNHKACFPIELPSKAISMSKETKLVLEPFSGSGTTMVASHQLNRKCYGMELDEKYCQVIIDRMSKLDETLVIKINGQEYTGMKSQNDN